MSTEKMIKKYDNSQSNENFNLLKSDKVRVHLLHTGVRHFKYEYATSVRNPNF